MRNIAKRSATSRKGWRTRKRMVQARKVQQYFVPDEQWIEYGQHLAGEFVDFLQPETVTGQIGVLQEVTTPRAQATQAWPTYMKRALPNPWNKALPPW